MISCIRLLVCKFCTYVRTYDTFCLLWWVRHISYFGGYLVLYQIVLRWWATCVMIHGKGFVVPPYMGSGWTHMHPPDIVPTHPLITLSFVARGNI